jgi:hypothetical protein
MDLAQLGDVGMSRYSMLNTIDGVGGRGQGPSIRRSTATMV